MELQDCGGMAGSHSEPLAAALTPVFVRRTSTPMLTARQKREGIDALRRGDPAAAVRALRQVVRADHNDAEALGYLGIAYTSLQDFDYGITCLKSAVRLAPGSAPLQYNLGMALEKSGSLGEAVALYQHVLLLDPTYERAERALQRLATPGDQLGAADPVERPRPLIRTPAKPGADSLWDKPAENVPEPQRPKTRTPHADEPSPAVRATLRAAAVAVSAQSAELQPVKRVDWPFIGACSVACVGLLWLALQAAGSSIRAGSVAPFAGARTTNFPIPSVRGKSPTEDADGSLGSIRNPALEREISAVATAETGQRADLPQHRLPNKARLTAAFSTATAAEPGVKADQLVPRVQRAASDSEAYAERAKRYHEFADLYARRNPASPAVKEQRRAAAYLDTQANHARAVRDQERWQLAEAYLREHQKTEAVRQLLEIRDGRDADATARAAAARRLQEIAAAAR